MEGPQVDLPSVAHLQQQFLTERRYLKNITERSIGWYRSVFRLYAAIASGLPTKATLQQFVITLRERDVQPVTINSYRTALNAFCKWLHDEGHIPVIVRMPHLKAPKRVLVTLTDVEVQRLVRAAKPSTFTQWRLYALVCLIIDTGMRIDEALTLTRANLDLDSLLVKVFGKGQKERVVPLSVAGRKALWCYLKKAPDHSLFIVTRDGRQWGQRNSLRALNTLATKAGLSKFGWHRLRHTFATNYLRKGGDVVRLSRVLGHSDISTTMRYVHLVTVDLQEMQQRTSLLNGQRSFWDCQEFCVWALG